jgi:phosphate transport system substrate-binding protein
MKLMKLRRAASAVFAGAVVFGACSSSSSGTTLNGSGSTFQQTFNEAAIAAFQKANSGTTINYAGGGSGKGKTDLQTKTVDFAGTDSLVKPGDLSKYQGGTILYFPTVAAPITVSFNVGNVSTLQLSGPTLAKIFDAQITKWNDPAIAQENPGVSLPTTTIVIVHRADASGTTNNFTKFLTLAGGSAWTLGTGDTVNWPANSQAGQGNTGVAQAVSQTDGAVGYVDLADAKAANLKMASVKNAAGQYIAPTVEGANAAVAASKIGADLTYSPIYASGATSYPITSPTWIIVYEKQTDHKKGTALKNFLNYVLTSGQSLANPNNYASLPSSVRTKAVAQLQLLQIPS